MNKELLHKFVSRKLIVAAGTIVTAVGAKQYIAAAVTAVAYLITQGILDLKTVKSAGSVVAEADKVVNEVAPLLPANLQAAVKVADVVATDVTAVTNKVN